MKAEVYIKAVEQGNTKNNKLLIGVVIAIAVLGLGWFFFFRNPDKNDEVAANAPITGTVTYTALSPDPEDADKGTVIIKYKPFKSKDGFESTGQELPVENNAAWKWTGATSGKSYDLVAVLMVDNKEIKQSETVTVTAPAVNVILPLHIDWDDLPDEFIEKATAQVKGTAIINGYIPGGSTLTISAKEASSQDFQVTQTFNSPKATQSWVWPNAKRGTEYNIKADLTQGGNLIGSTGSLTAIAGSNAVTMILTSRATPPAPANAVISGNVIINGPLQNNSAVIIQAQPENGSTTTVAQISNPSNGSNSWQWTTAKSGVAYQLTAILQVNGNNASSARFNYVTAPASNVNFTINTGATAPTTPGTQASLDSCTNSYGNIYNATIRWPNQPDAGSYWEQIGDNPGQSNLLDQKVSVAGNQGNQRSTVEITGGQFYHARWAYAFCSNCTADSNFSNFSPDFKFYCGANPITPTPTPTPIPTLTPSPSPTPKISQCGQTCGSNGFSCATGLACTSIPGGQPGSQTCQNQACPGEPDCICPLQ